MELILEFDTAVESSWPWGLLICIGLSFQSYISIMGAACARDATDFSGQQRPYEVVTIVDPPRCKTQATPKQTITESYPLLFEPGVTPSVMLSFSTRELECDSRICRLFSLQRGLSKFVYVPAGVKFAHIR